MMKLPAPNCVIIISYLAVFLSWRDVQITAGFNNPASLWRLLEGSTVLVNTILNCDAIAAPYLCE